MGSRIGRFVKDQRGTTFEGIALSVSIIAVAFVASADLLDYATKSHDNDAMVALHKAAMPANVATADLDRTSTASLPHLITRSVLDPCTGASK